MHVDAKECFCVCLCVCVCCPLLGSTSIGLSLMSDSDRSGQIRDPVANTSSPYTSPMIVDKIQT